MAKIDQIARDVYILKERLVERVPGHFGMSHIMTSFFGALFFGFTFVLKGLLLQVGLALSSFHLMLITITTWALLSAEIYFVGYRRVPNKDRRPFGQFWAKRIIAYYLISLFVSFLLLFVYGITTMVPEPYLVFKLVVAVSFPAAVGAAVADLLGKY
jgi:uncharacterized membrane protein